MTPMMAKHCITLQVASRSQKHDGTETTWSAGSSHRGLVRRLGSKERQAYLQSHNTVATHKVVLNGQVEVTLAGHRFKWNGKILYPLEEDDTNSNCDTVIICGSNPANSEQNNV